MNTAGPAHESATRSDRCSVPAVYGKGLLRLRWWGFVLTAIAFAFLVLWSRQVNRKFGLVFLVLGLVISWLGFADEAGMPGGERLKRTALLCAIGVVIGTVVSPFIYRHP